MMRASRERNYQAGVRRPIAALAAAAVLSGALAMPVLADINNEPTGEEMVADVLVARPIGVAATLLGTAAFIVSLPFSLLGGNVDKAAEGLVLEPGRETFVRCLGCRNTGRRDAGYSEPQNQR